MKRLFILITLLCMLTVNAFSQNYHREICYSDPYYYETVEEKPSFQGGDISLFSEWVRERLVYPDIAKEKCIEGRVLLEFIIEEDGSVIDVQVKRGFAPYNYKEKLNEAYRKLRWAETEERIEQLKSEIDYITATLMLDQEAVRVVSMSPNWTPGKHNGKPVYVHVPYLVIFQLR